MVAGVLGAQLLRAGVAAAADRSSRTTSCAARSAGSASSTCSPASPTSRCCSRRANRASRARCRCTTAAAERGSRQVASSALTSRRAMTDSAWSPIAGGWRRGRAARRVAALPRRAGAARRRRRHRPHPGARARSRGRGAGGARRRSARRDARHARRAWSSTIGWTSRSRAAPTASTCAATRSRSRRRGALAPPGFLIGRSVHGVDDAAQAAGRGLSDCRHRVPVRVEERRRGRCSVSTGFARSCAAVGVPVLAIGGITEDRFDEVAAAGAAGVAAIGLFMAAEASGGTLDAILPRDSARRHRRTRPGAV